MPAKVFVSQVVFPHEIARLDRPAFLIGWNTEQFHCTITGAVPVSLGEEKGEEDFFAALGEALRCSYADPNFVLSVHRKYPFPPTIVGQWFPSARSLAENPPFADNRNNNNNNKSGNSNIKSSNNCNSSNSNNNSNDISASAAHLPEPRFQQESIWITLSQRADERVCVSSIFSLGSRYETACYLVSFRGVHSDALQSLHLCDSLDGRTLEQQPLLVTQKPTTTKRNSAKNKEHNAAQFWREKTELADIVIQINAASDLMRVTEHYVEVLLARRNKRDRKDRPEKNERASTDCVTHSLSFFEKISLRTVSLLSYPVDKLLTSSQVLQAELSKPVPWLTNACRALTWQRLFPTRNISTKEAQFAPSSSTRPDSFESSQSSHEHRNPVEDELSSTTSFLLHNFTVYGFSFFLCEMNERLRDLRNALRLCACFALSWNVDSSFNAKIFLRVLSIAVLVFVDVALGLLCARWLYAHAHEVIAFAIECTDTLHKRLFLENLQWLDHAPGGVKLNPLITHKLSKGIAIFIHDAYALVFPTSSHTSLNRQGGDNSHKELVVWVVRTVVCSLSGVGLSLQLALLADLCSLFTMPFTILHALFAFFLRHLSLFISSLWLLFWGQKQNILRKRIDTCEADREQLLMAMILFFIAVFVWPSFCAYYLLLALFRVLVLLLICVPWQCVVLLREFPLVPVVLFMREKLCRFVQRVSGVPREMLSECDHLLSDGVQISLTHVESGKSSSSLSPSAWAERITFRSMEQSERDIHENRNWNGVRIDHYNHSINEESRENEDDGAFSGGAIISERSLRQRDSAINDAMRSKPVSTLSRMTQQEIDSICDEASDATFPSTNDVQTVRSQNEYRDVPVHKENTVWQWQSSKSQSEQTTAMFELKPQGKSFLSLFSSYREWIRFLFVEHRVFSNLLLRICQSETLFLRIINLTLIFYHQKQRRMEVAVSAMLQQNDQLLSVGKPSITFRESMSVNDITRLCQASDISETLSSSLNQRLSANPRQRRWNLLLLLLVVVMTVFYLFFAIVGNILSLVVHVAL